MVKKSKAKHFPISGTLLREKVLEVIRKIKLEGIEWVARKISGETVDLHSGEHF